MPEPYVAPVPPSQAPYDIHLSISEWTQQRLSETVRELARVDDIAVGLMLAQWQAEWGKPRVLYQVARCKMSQPALDRYAISSGLIGLCSTDSSDPLVTVGDVHGQLQMLLGLLRTPDGDPEPITAAAGWP